MLPILRLLPILLLSLATLPLAAQFRFFTDHSRVFEGQTASVFVENFGEEAVRGVQLDIVLSPRIRFGQPISTVPHEWTCTQLSDTRARCNLGTIEPGVFGGVFFSPIAIDREGGHHTATVTFSARNLQQPPVVFDVITGASFRVSSDGDFGPGTLRAAIDAVNEHPLCGTDVPCSIGFDRAMTIAPVTPLPAIRKCHVSLFGPDFFELPRRIKEVVISGQNATHGNGLEVRASCGANVPGVSISGIAVHSWPWNGIYFEAPGPHVEPASGHSVGRSYIGTDAGGTEARPNGSRGIVADSPHEIVSVGTSIVSGNRRSGIFLVRGLRAFIGSVSVGAGLNGEPIGNGASGIYINGVDTRISSSTIVHNAHAGVAIAQGTPGAWITFSQIHSNANLPIDWGLDERTPDDDETDRVPNAPRLTEAFYEPASNRTIVRGVVRLRAGVIGDSFAIELHHAVHPRGDVLGRIPLPDFRLFAPRDGSAADVPFEIAINGDRRGQLIAAQTNATVGSALPTLSSEISEAIAVR